MKTGDKAFAVRSAKAFTCQRRTRRTSSRTLSLLCIRESKRRCRSPWTATSTASGPAKTLSARYAVTKLTKDFGSEQTVRKLCNASPKILHFATHAICYTDQLRRDQYGYFDFPHNYDPERPELTYTGLVLSGGNIGFKRTGNRRLDNDGILLSEEIAKLHLENTDLAVLSACNSANGIFDDIDGTLGLVKAFKLAGVNTIIASLSKVDDRATSEFMSHFYQRLSRGESLHTSFINAINHMKTRYPDQPKFWAMFKMIDCREP